MKLKHLYFTIILITFFSCDNKRNTYNNKQLEKKDTLIYKIFFDDMEKIFTINNQKINGTEFPKEREIDLIYLYHKTTKKILPKINLDLVSQSPFITIKKINNQHFKIYIDEKFNEKIMKFDTYYYPKKNQIIYNVYDSTYYEYPERFWASTYHHNVVFE